MATRQLDKLELLPRQLEAVEEALANIASILAVSMPVRLKSREQYQAILAEIYSAFTPESLPEGSVDNGSNSAVSNG